MASFGLNIKIPRESLIKLSNHENKHLIVKFNGGRQVQGALKSWDKQMNLILDNCQEILGVDQTQKQQIKRQLGLIIVKGSQIQSICLKDGYKLIDNPYENLVQGDSQEDKQQDQGQQQNEQEQQKQVNQSKKIYK